LRVLNQHVDKRRAEVLTLGIILAKVILFKFFFLEGRLVNFLRINDVNVSTSLTQQEKDVFSLENWMIEIE
jgi:hypothetical protein